MASKWSVEFDGLDEVVSKLTRLNANVKSITNEALKETHSYVTEQAEIGMQKGSLPAKGKYSTGKTLESLQRTPKFEWVGTIGSVETGFDLENGGMPSIFLMYGTPSMKKDQKLWSAFFSKKTKDKVKEIQEKIFYDELRRLE